ncbi:MULTISPECIES: CynX/NimT family MFS transporter [Mammaliicoccus]|uniref:CynX/NimT family MFS transporter n=1 Tax=Mammaliicoccus TaxID=2803850 RepID=UPI0018E992C8|nr:MULTISPECIES: MFS transporter [Mammaliicoccus]MBO3061563.1 MFS transporter [Mammaliicoccus fleurettii]MEB7724062.1 MFS transporter [Mammaliicoccus fleurettii]MEB7806057.1 MFS transporter [Mammaliicoccus fleurettii]MEB8068168.1 MFS transporter [Mammaliicoccus fleurettii]
MENNIKKYKFKDIWLILFGMIFVASTLRAPLTSVGPVIELIKSDLEISNSLAGFLTTIPLILFGFVSPMVSKIVTKLTMSSTILYALVILLIGLLLRVSGDIGLFIIGTILLGVAIAFGNVCLPSYVKWRFPLQIGLFTGVYSATMNFTAGLGGGLSYPLSEITPLGFRLSLSFWVVLTILAIIFWIPQVKSGKQQEVQATKEMQNKVQGPKVRMSTSKLAWVVALTMAMQSMVFYTVIAWMPTILIDKGLSPTAAGYLLMLNQFSQVPMTFIFPIIASKMQNQKLLVTIVSMLFILGFSLLFSQSYIVLIVGIIIAGFGMGAGFSLCMTFFSIRARTNAGSMSLSGFGQSVGYFIAAIGPFLIGFLHDLLGGWDIGIISLIIISVLFYIFALQAANDQYVED